MPSATSPKPLFLTSFANSSKYRITNFLRKLRLLRFLGDAVAFKFWKKKWERETCTFELQEYGAAGKPGWATISNPAGEIPKKEECIELFHPGCHYRIMAKGVETGKMVGVVWKHYEPLPGGLQAKPEKEEKAPPPREQRGPRTGTEWMKQYAGEVAETLGPLAELLNALQELPQLFGGVQGQGQQANPQQWPQLEFSGKAPWVLHPYIVREIGNQITEVSDHIMDRLSGLPAEAAKKMETEAAKTGAEEEEGEEMPLLPNPEEYVGEQPPIDESETVPVLVPNEKATRKTKKKGK